MASTTPTTSSCTAYINPEDDGRYTRPLPWIGLYAAGASVVCAALIAADLYRSLHRRKVWIAPKLFSVNAATLTVLAVATKLPSDITTTMPGLIDQLSKLSGTVLVCVALNHAMPCLGLMDGAGVLSNVIALGIMVVTLFVNILIQIGTGVITAADNALFAGIMLMLFAVFVSYSLAVTTMKKMVEKEYNIKHQMIVREMMVFNSDVLAAFSTERLKGFLDKYWLMALSSSPDYTVLSSGLCSVSASLCYMVVSFNFILPVLTKLAQSRQDGGSRSCYYSSDYQWSTIVIFGFQMVAILTGTVASVMRGVNSRPDSSFSSWRALFRIERHWIILLLKWREAPLHFKGAGRKSRRFMLRCKNLAVDVLLVFQVGVIFASKLLVLSMKLASRIMRRAAAACGIRCCCSDGSVEPREQEDGSSNLGCLTEYVLCLHEEEILRASEVVRRWRKYPERWIETGRNNQPGDLLGLLRWISFSEDLRRYYDEKLGASARDRPQVPCWSLIAATLAAIAQALSSPDPESSGSTLVRSIGQGLRYMEFIEKNLGTKEVSKKQEIANMVWEGVELHGRWLHVDLHSLAAQEGSNPIVELRGAAQKQLQESKDGGLFRWPSKQHAAECMLLITSLLYRSERSSHQSMDLRVAGVSEQLNSMAAYIFRSSLVSLPMAIFAQCFAGSFGEREEAVREASMVLGEVETLLPLLPDEELRRVFPTYMEDLHDFCP